MGVKKDVFYTCIRQEATTHSNQEGQNPISRLGSKKITHFLAPRNNLHTHPESGSLSPPSTTGRASPPGFIGHMDPNTPSSDHCLSEQMVMRQERSDQHLDSNEGW